MSAYLPIHGGPCFFNSPHQKTPLHWAADGGHVDTVRYLVDKGDDINMKDGHGVSELEYTADCKLGYYC